MNIVQSQSYRAVTAGGEVIAYPSPTYDAMYAAILVNATARPMVLKKRDIAFREGINIEPNFAVKCMSCDSEFEHKMDSCEKCGSMVREPDLDEEKICKGLLELKNANRQNLQDVLEEISVDHDVADDGWLVSRNLYHELNGQIVDFETTEFWRIHPGNAAYSMTVGGRIGEFEYTCIYHREFYTSNQYNKCNVCSRILHKVIAVRFKDQKIVMRYIEPEIFHGSEYNPTAIYGFPPALTMWYHLVLTAAQTKYMADYYVDKKWPSAALFVPAKKRVVAELFGDKLDQEVNKDVQGRPIFRFDPESKHKPEVIRMTDTPEEMQFIAVREESRMRMAAFWGISPIFNNDVQSSGGLNNESRQITVMSWATENKQKAIRKNYLDPVIESRGIKDWHFELGKIEEEDEAAEVQLDILKMTYAQGMQGMGFKVVLDDEGKPTKFEEMEQSQDPFAAFGQQPEQAQFGENQQEIPQTSMGDLSGQESVMIEGTKSIKTDKTPDDYNSEPMVVPIIDEISPIDQVPDHYNFTYEYDNDWEWAKDYDFVEFVDISIYSLNVHPDFALHPEDVEKGSPRVRKDTLYYYAVETAEMRPLIVDQNYNLIDGHHRLYALMDKNQKEIRVAIVKPKDKDGLKAGNRAPKGGVTINGKFYSGGQFIPVEKFYKTKPSKPKKKKEPIKKDKASKEYNDTINRPEFKKWFGDSKILKSNNNPQESEPIELFHGTTFNFTNFDKNKTNVSSDLGGGFYFTNNLKDAKSNYATETGADVRDKIETEMNILKRKTPFNDERKSWSELEDEFGERQAQKEAEKTNREWNEKRHEWENKIYDEAKSNVTGGENYVFRVFLKVDNPAYFKHHSDKKDLIEPKKLQETLLRVGKNYVGGMRGETEDIDYAIKSIMSQPRTRKTKEFLELDEKGGWAGSNLEGDEKERWKELKKPTNMWEEGATPKEMYDMFKNAIHNSSSFNFIRKDQENEPASGQFVQDVLKELGYDGLIAENIEEWFGIMSGTNKETNHYIVFEPNQIKSTDSSNFDINTNNVFKSTNDEQLPSLKTGEHYTVDPSQTRGRPKKQKEETELSNIKINFPEIDIVDGNIWLYHGTGQEHRETILNDGLLGGDNSVGGTHSTWDEPTLFLTPDLPSAKKYGDPLLIKLNPEEFEELGFQRLIDNAGDTAYILEAKEKEWDKILINSNIIEEYYIDDESFEFSEIFSKFDNKINEYIQELKKWAKKEEIDIDDIEYELEDYDNPIIESIRDNLSKDENYKRLDENMEDKMYNSIRTLLLEELDILNLKSAEAFDESEHPRAKDGQFTTSDSQYLGETRGGLSTSGKVSKILPKWEGSHDKDMTFLDKYVIKSYEFEVTVENLENSVNEFADLSFILLDLEQAYQETFKPSKKREITALQMMLMEVREGMAKKVEQVVTEIEEKGITLKTTDPKEFIQLAKNIIEMDLPSMEELKNRQEKLKKPLQERL